MLKKKLPAILFLLVISILLSGKIFSQNLIQDREFNVNPGQKLKVETPVGDLHIKTWGENKVAVKIYGNKRAEDKIEFKFRETDEGVEIKAEKEGSSFFNWFRSYKMKFQILVPENFDLDLHTSGGDVLVSDVKGMSKIYTSGGDIHLKNMSGNLLGKTSGGDVEVLEYQGDVEVKTSGGDITTEKVKGDVKVSTSGGDVEILSTEGPVEAKTSGGNITLKYMGANRGIYLSTSGGDIDILLDRNFAAEVNLQTSGGDVEVDFPNATVRGKIKSSRFEGEFNNGGESLTAKTSGGDITVKTK